MEPSFFNSIAQELGKIFGSSFRLHGQQAVGGGCISRSAKLSTTHGHFFIKWNSSCASDLFVREAEGLRALRQAAQSELIIPEVILAAEAGQEPGYIVLEYLQPGHVSGEDEKLGTGLAFLHRFGTSRFGFGRDNYCGSTLQKNDWQPLWTDFFVENRLQFLLQQLAGAGRYHPKELDTFDRLMARLPALLPGSPLPSLIHGDLWSGNYLYTQEGPALIDPAAYYAHREMELSMMKLFGGFSARTWRAYQDAFPLDAGWEERTEIYQLYHLLNHYMLFGGSYGRQALALAGKFAG